MAVISGQGGKKNPLVLTHWVICRCVEVLLFPRAELELFFSELLQFSLRRSQSHLLSSWKIGEWRILIISSQRRITALSPTTKLSASLSGELQACTWKDSGAKKEMGQGLGSLFFGTSRHTRDTSVLPRAKPEATVK